MPVKVVVKGQKPVEETGMKIPRIHPPAPSHRHNIIIRMFKIMVMDIRMRLDPELRRKYAAYCRFSELAFGERR